MRNIFALIGVVVLMMVEVSGCSPSQDSLVMNLRVENTDQPIGIDVRAPRFSWQMKTDLAKKGQRQQAYCVTVKDENQQEMWNSGKVLSDESINIYYQGKELQPCTRYNWQVSVWDQDGVETRADSWFETGLLNPSLTAWDGAGWIGGTDEDLVLNADYLSVFRLKYTVQLDQSANRASFVFGANDPRLMDANMNLYGLANEVDQSYVKLCLNIEPLVSGKGREALLDIYRVGYAETDSKETPLFSYPIPAKLVNSGNMYDPHTIQARILFGLLDLYVDGEGNANRITPVRVSRFGGSGETDCNLNPVGRGGDYICFPVLGEIGYATDAGQKARFTDIAVANYREPCNTIYADAGEEIGGAEAVFTVKDPSRNAQPMLRTTFSAKKKPQKARLYVTARGVYEVYLNGKRVGNDYFNPGLTQYNKTHTYQTYDVTSMIQSGENAIGVLLGEGWWSGPATFMGAAWNLFGDRQSLLAKLVLTYSDGIEQVVASDDTWKYYADGPIRLGSFFQGERYDATKEADVDGWATIAYNDSGWKSAKVHQGDGIHATNDFDRTTFAPFEGHEQTELIGLPGENPQVVDELTAQSVNEIRPGVFIYDMGQNMVGVPEIEIQDGTAGEVVALRYSEVLYPDLPEYESKKGTLMTENLRAAMVRDEYRMKGGREVIAPRFTFHGYRYLEITGLSQALPLENVRGKVISSVHQVASNYYTSNEKVNRLWQNIVWSSLGNFLSIPTDCPQRNERMGWSGDMSVFSKTATYISNMDAFLTRHLLALRNSQRENGRYGDVAPVGGGFGGLLWGSVGIVTPWEVYSQYGDLEALKQHYPSMKQYLSFLISSIDPKTNNISDGLLGDWLSPVNSQNDNNILFDSYYIYELEIMSKVATLLGNTVDAKEYADLYQARKDYFNRTYLDKQRRTIFSPHPFTFAMGPTNTSHKRGDLMDTQVSYAVPLALHIVSEEDREAFAANLVNSIKRPTTDDLGVERPAYSLLTGFVGTCHISNALSEAGYPDVAYRLLLNEQYPSWLYPVEQGATTIWERLNSYTKDNGFGGNNSMNSFNHYSFGAVGAWMLNHSLGISRDEQSPGFKHFLLTPTPDPNKEMTFAEGYYDSYYGRIESQWAYSDDKRQIEYQFVIPANTSATLRLPAGGQVQLPSNPTGIQALTGEDGTPLYELASGVYQFTQEVE